MADPPKKSKPTSESPIPKSFQQRDTQGSVNDRASLSSIRDVKIKDAPSRRIAIRLLISTMRFELAMLATVLVYCVLVFANLAIDDPEVSDMIDEGDLNRLHKAFLYIDLIFLIFFCMEIAIKMYAFGSIAYLKDLFNLTDAIIVWGSFIITCVAIHMDQTNSTLLRSMPILRVVKVVRLVRVVLAMTRIQRSRDRYRRTKMCGIGAPVDRVFEMIEELKLKVKEEDDEKTLAWTMELIAKEQLYTGSFVSQQNNHLMSADMTDWVRSNLQVHFHSPQERNTHASESVRRSSSEARGRRKESEPKGDAAPSTTSGDTNKRALIRRLSASQLGYDGLAGGKKERGAAPESGLAQRSDAVPWLNDMLSQTPVKAALERCDSWDMDPFLLDRATNGRPLVVGAMYLLQRIGVTDKLNVPGDKLANFLAAVERRYRPTNPFHNALHATDTVFTTHYFLQRPLLRGMLGPLDKLAAIIAAAVHDYGHPGLNNAFLVASRHENAILYNDQSILEMYHIAGAWRTLLTEPGCNFAEGFSRDQYRQLREAMVSMVLATDLKYHFEHLGRLKMRLMSDAFVTVDRKDVLFLLGQVVHAADISNCTKPPNLQFQWTKRVMTEFFMQGDLEASIGLPISAMMNRETTLVPQVQMGFIKALVMPLYVEIRKLLGEECQICVDTLKGTLTGWETDGAALCEDWDLSHPGGALAFDYVHPVMH